ncbi:MAG: dihydrofolate reductase, partial [Mesorhizobium sp.]
VRVGGGVATIRQYLLEKLIDEMHLAVSPLLLGKGENLFAGLDMPGLGYQCTKQVATPLATHVIIERA